MLKLLLYMAVIAISLCCAFHAAAQTAGSGLLFYLSGDSSGDGFTADYANGDPEPAYLNEYTLIPDGAKGRGFSAPHSEEKLMTYLAPGNIYAQRGTLSFFWRSRDPVGGMPFKIFYVSYCDHSSLDMTWLRVDYNGEQGFDAFVTDADMARVRVSYRPASFPAPETWTHFAFSWDETKGVRLYINGSLAAQKDTVSVFDAGLGLFQPHGRFSTPGTVTSNCGHLRGGDIDEICIYDRMLSDDQVRRLAAKEIVHPDTPFVRSLTDGSYRDEWWFRHGWNRPGDLPLRLASSAYAIRKVEIHDARDQKRWVWRSNDGIRETTWPNVYNRSRLPGRSDYFIEPDWYCYSTSGKSIVYTLPDEPWNYCEITGAAYGSASRVETQHAASLLDTEQQPPGLTGGETPLIRRPPGQERTFHILDRSYFGGKIRYTNEVRETPLAEFQVYDVAPGIEPEGTVKLSYILTGLAEPDNRSLSELVGYIDRRFPPDERQIMVGLPAGAPSNRKDVACYVSTNPLPLVHILIPSEFRNEGPRTSRGAYAGFHYEWENMHDGLDGIAIDIPPLDVRPTHGDCFLLNIQVRDPLWPNRSMIDFSFAVRPKETKTLWLDTRDRILPDGRSFYIVIAGSGSDFGPAALEGAQVRLIFKDREQAVAEHEIDRFTQIRDNFAGNLSETYPQRKKLEFMERFTRDIKELFKVNPGHIPGRYYWSSLNPEQGWPPFEQPEPPGLTGGLAPLWAFRQIEIVKQWQYFLNWWIDNRQIANGEFGGGLSDDGDFANCLPGLALLGVDTEKITDSLRRLMEAYYENGMFTNGLNTILTDALHASEEGTNVQSELMLLDYGSPKLVERMLETSSRYVDITKINAAGHRHFPSSFYSSTKMATENPWCWSSRYSYTILYPGMAIVEYNGQPAVKQLIQEYGDGILAHAKTDENGRTVLPMEINFITDEGRAYSTGAASQVFSVLYRWTHDRKYLSGTNAPQQGTVTAVDKTRLEKAYAGAIQYNSQRMYMATEGFPWDDGPYITYGSIIEDRLGGAPVRRGAQFPEHTVSWRFDTPYDGTSTAILVPEASSTSLKVIVYNIEKDPVRGTMIGWGVAPGAWEVTEGIDTDGDDNADSGVRTRTVPFERTTGIDFDFPPRKTLIITMKLKKEGTPYWKRPDLGIGAEDVRVNDKSVTVTVHNLGSVDSQAATLALVDGSGRVSVETGFKPVCTTPIPPLKAPLDFKPKTVTVQLPIPPGASLRDCVVTIDPDGTLNEITTVNNTVKLP